MVVKLKKTYTRKQMCEMLMCSPSLLEVYDSYKIFLAPINTAQGRKRYYSEIDLYKGKLARILRYTGIPYRTILDRGLTLKNKKLIDEAFDKIIREGIAWRGLCEKNFLGAKLKEDSHGLAI